MQSFTYDALDRLASAEATGGTMGIYAQETYSYTVTTGNLASKAGTDYIYGDSDHVHAVTALSNGNSYSYDSNGNMTGRIVGSDTYTLTYDVENHMTGVSGAATAAFEYNGDGQRVAATVMRYSSMPVGICANGLWAPADSPVVYPTHGVIRARF